jgi:hypothetical protein
MPPCGDTVIGIFNLLLSIKYAHPHVLINKPDEVLHSIQDGLKV